MRNRLILVGVFALSPIAISLAWAEENKPQPLSGVDRDTARSMLEIISSDIKKYYYDPKFHGLDWDARVKVARTRVDNSPSLNAALSHIAGALDALDDSHTFFIPPQRTYRYDYGFHMQMIGDHCRVIRVRPQSDAEAEGLKPGDEVRSVNGLAPTRDIFLKMNYVYNILRPQRSLRLDLRTPSGNQRQLDVRAKESMGMAVFNMNGIMRQSEDKYLRRRPRWTEFDDLIILNIPAFNFSEVEANDLIRKARTHKALIIDLRSNGGGYVESLKALLGLVFDHDVTIADRVRRSGRTTLVAKSHQDSFSGKLAVLVDSNSASASELFARVIQIEKRGTVFGDHTAGSVMEAEHYNYHTGFNAVAFFAASITEANLIMTDGKSLEHVGVSPDELVIPSGEDLASGRDPVLTRAAEGFGLTISPEQAGKLFPYEWPKQ